MPGEIRAGPRDDQSSHYTTAPDQSGYRLRHKSDLIGRSLIDRRLIAGWPAASQTAEIANILRGLVR
jgi:hypothetical protein